MSDKQSPIHRSVLLAFELTARLVSLLADDPAALRLLTELARRSAAGETVLDAFVR
jgi:hypothetical protein